MWWSEGPTVVDYFIGPPHPLKPLEVSLGLATSFGQ